MFNFTKKLLLGVTITSTCAILLSSDGCMRADIEKARQMLADFKATEVLNVVILCGETKQFTPIEDIGRVAVHVVNKLPNDILTDFRLAGYDGSSEKPLDAMVEVLTQRNYL